MFSNRPDASQPASRNPLGQHTHQSAPPKYIFDNGIKKINPAYKEHQRAQAGQTPAQAALTSVADPGNALAIISSLDDVDHAQAAQHGSDIRIAESTIASIEIIQDEDYLNRFGRAPVDGGKIIDGLGRLFERFETPLGMVNKLLILSEYKLHFIVDDSGSMELDSDVIGPHNRLLTRWQEAEQRLQQLMVVMAYVPCEGIRVSFLNRTDTLELQHENLTPEQFQQHAGQALARAFQRRPAGGTPTYQALSRALAQNRGATAFYLMTDGEPPGGYRPVADLVLNRPNPGQTPLTFLSCTNNDEEADWMKQIEERAPYTAELDDFNDEKTEVLHDQGPAMPYSYGMWLISNLCAAMHPDDLDAMDESVPFAKRTLDNLLGYETSPREYEHYFAHHAPRWGRLLPAFQSAMRAADIPEVQHYRAQVAQQSIAPAGVSRDSQNKLEKMFSNMFR